MAFERAGIEDVDHEEVARLGALHADGAGEIVHGGQVDIADIVGGIVVGDGAAGPVHGLDDEVGARLDPGGDRNVRVPAIVQKLVFRRGLGKIDRNQCLRHGALHSPL